MVMKDVMSQAQMPVFSLFRFVVSATLTMFLLAGCATHQQNNDSAGDTSASPSPAASPVPVAVATAITRQVSAFIPATGSFAADESSDVAPEVSGQVTATPVDVGDFVREGAVIARLDDRDAQLKLAQAQASERQAAAAVRQAQARLGIGQGETFDVSEVPEVRAARRQYEAAEAQARLAETNARRYEKLIETGDVSRSVYDQARAQAETARAQAQAARQQYEAALNNARQGNQNIAGTEAALAAARAQVAIARKAVSDTIIRAPISGYVSDRPAAPGEAVSPATKVATIQRINPIKLRLQLSEADAGRSRIGMPVKASVAAYPEREFTGRVTAINPAIDPNSRTVTVEAQIDNPDTLLRPGMFATAQLIQPGGEQAVFVPRAAVINDPATNSAHVFVIENNTARVRVVQTGETENDLIRITTGLGSGEVIAVSHLEQLFDGAPVSAQRQ